MHAVGCNWWRIFFHKWLEDIIAKLVPPVLDRRPRNPPAVRLSDDEAEADEQDN